MEPRSLVRSRAAEVQISGVAGDVHAVKANAAILVEVDLDLDCVADLWIELTSVSTLTAATFLDHSSSQLV